MKLARVIAAAALFTGGIAVGYASQKVDTSLYHGKSKVDAAKALLEVARVQAGDGSWERIGIGRVYYLGGMKSEGQAIFDGVLAGKHKSSDLFRIAKVYREAGEWPKAKALFDSYVRDNPDDSQEVAQIGAYTLINGDRAGAERLFDQSFNSSVDMWGTIAAAGAYLGVVPQE
ncbi:MAG: tetratricopeptide repeat protein [Dokdonella sp.]